MDFEKEIVNKKGCFMVMTKLFRKGKNKNPG